MGFKEKRCYTHFPIPMSHDLIAQQKNMRIAQKNKNKKSKRDKKNETFTTLSNAELERSS